MIRWKRSWPDLEEHMPFYFGPVSNGEYEPQGWTDQQRLAQRLQEQKGEEVRRQLGMSRRQFVRSAAAMAVGLWAANEAFNARWAGATHKSSEACDLQNPNVQLANLPGEFVFDIQSHHVDEEGTWRVANPGFHAFFIAAWNAQTLHCGEADPVECLSRYHYVKELYLDSSTNMTVLSAVPSSPERNPLPTIEAFETSQLVHDLSHATSVDTGRIVMHTFVMPNRGSYDGNVNPGLFQQAELDAMTQALEQYRIGGSPVVRAWKCYTPWGDVPNVSGWFHDDPFGRKMIEHAITIGLPVIATHKGFALPSFDQASAACKDVGIVAREYFNPLDDAKSLKMIVYHSGFDNENQQAYAGDATANSSNRGTDSLIKSLRENGWSARHFAGGSPGTPGAPGDGDPNAHANVPNVYAEIGSTWRSVSSDPEEGAHLLGKLVYYVGPRRVVWGTDSLWYGSPQAEIVKLRNFGSHAVSQQIFAEQYHLPYGIGGDRFDPAYDAHDPASYTSSVHPEDPTWPHDFTAHPERSIRNGIFGRNAAEVYKVDPDTPRNLIDCNDLQSWRDGGGGGYLLNAGTPRETRPLATNVVYGPKTRRELFASIWPNTPWAP